MNLLKCSNKLYHLTKLLKNQLVNKYNLIKHCLKLTTNKTLYHYINYFHQSQITQNYF